jgi:hypothetical protein
MYWIYFGNAYFPTMLTFHATHVLVAGRSEFQACEKWSDLNLQRRFKFAPEPLVRLVDIDSVRTQDVDRKPNGYPT